CSRADDPVEACRLLDRKFGLEAEEYWASPMDQRPDRSTYWVHEAPSPDWRPVDDPDEEVAALLPLVAKVVRHGATISPPSEAVGRVVAFLEAEWVRLKDLEEEEQKKNQRPH